MNFNRALLMYCKRYATDRKRVAFFLIVVYVLFALVYWLYNVPLAPFLYASILSGVALFCFVGYDLFCYLCEIQQLKKLTGQETFLTENLPMATNFQVKSYQEMLKKQDAKARKEAIHAAQQFQSAQDYYTKWLHQIKTPLAAMRLLLQEETLDRNALTGERLKTEQYANMALQYQRLSMTEHDFVLQELDLEPVVKRAVMELAPLFIHKKIALQLEGLSTEPFPTALTDEKWLQFILEQLLSNAVKYTSAEEGKVMVRYEAQTLQVIDNGIGIRTEDLPRVFEWGYTGYNGHQESRATGIGLSLCKKAATMLGHCITVESTIGQGTTFTIDLTRPDFMVE